jgi:uncharacterized protein YoxC
MYLEICLLVLSIAFFLLVIYCIPIFKQIWRTSKDIAVILETLNQNLPGILKNMEEITSNISSTTCAINREVQVFSNTICRFQSIIKDVVDDVQHITPVVLKLPAFKTFKNIIAVMKGVRAFMDVFLAREFKKYDRK